MGLENNGCGVQEQILVLYSYDTDTSLFVWQHSLGIFYFSANSILDNSNS